MIYEITFKYYCRFVISDGAQKKERMYLTVGDLERYQEFLARLDVFLLKEFEEVKREDFKKRAFEIIRVKTDEVVDLAELKQEMEAS